MAHQGQPRSGSLPIVFAADDEYDDDLMPTISDLVDSIVASHTVELTAIHAKLGSAQHVFETRMTELRSNITRQADELITSLRDQADAFVKAERQKERDMTEGCRVLGRQIEGMIKALGSTRFVVLGPLDVDLSQKTLLERHAALTAAHARAKQRIKGNEDRYDILFKDLSQCKQVLGETVHMPPEQQDEFPDVSEPNLIMMQREAERCRAAYDAQVQRYKAEMLKLVDIHVELRLDWTGAGDVVQRKVQEHVNLIDADPPFEKLEDVIDALEPLVPTEDILRRMSHLLHELERTQSEQQRIIQNLCDRVQSHWEMLDVPIEEQDQFIEANIGSSMDSIRAYEEEIERLRLLRLENLPNFISRLREGIQELWHELQVPADEQQSSLPSFHSTDVSEEILTAHEDVHNALLADRQSKQAILMKLKSYNVLKDEAHELALMSADSSRLLDRGAEARLARQREEQMRKRATRRPGVLRELIDLVAKWETEYARAFVYDGQSLLEELRTQEIADRPKPRIASASRLPSGAETLNGNGRKRVLSETPVAKRQKTESPTKPVSRPLPSNTRMTPNQRTQASLGLGRPASKPSVMQTQNDPFMQPHKKLNDLQAKRRRQSFRPAPLRQMDQNVMGLDDLDEEG